MDKDTIRDLHTIRICNGSGVIVRPLDKSFLYILTNYHVMFNDAEKEYKLTFKFEKGSSLNNKNITVCDKLFCKNKDLAILKIKAKDFENIDFLRLNTYCNNPQFHFGFPKVRYDDNAISHTNVLNIQNYDGIVNDYLVQYEYTKPVTKGEIEGMSGGGIFDDLYRLVGIHKQSSNDDEKELLGKYCYIPIIHYKKLLKDANWSPILEFDLNSFVELVNIAFDFKDKYIEEKAIELLAEIDKRKSKIKNLSPINVIQILKENKRLKEETAIDDFSRDFWIDFTEFIIAMVILLDINEPQNEFIISVFDKFHFVFSQKEFDFYDVRNELDLNLIVGMNYNAKLVVGGMAAPNAFNACVIDKRIPNISDAGIVHKMDISNDKRRILNSFTIINNKIFKKCIPHILDLDNQDVTLENYKKEILNKIDNGENKN